MRNHNEWSCVVSVSERRQGSHASNQVARHQAGSLPKASPAPPPLPATPAGQPGRSVAAERRVRLGAKDSIEITNGRDRLTRTLISATVVAAMSVASFTCAAEPAYLPGGEAVKKAVEARRGKTDLSKLAASMKPASWAQLKTEMPQGLWSSPKVNGGRNKGGAGGLHIAGWTDDAHWDSRTGQFLYLGLRQTRQFIAYSEEKNAWRVISLDRTSDNPVFRTRFGHVYGTNGFDHERSRFYHLYRSFEQLEGGISYFHVATEKWTKLPPRPAGSGGMCIEYFGAMDGLVVLGKQMWIFRHDRQKWENLGESPVDGYHSMFRHNPYRDEVLMAGGNHAPRVVARLKKDGQIERLNDSPVPLSIRGDKVTVDPVSGRYLILGGKKDEPKKLYEFDSGRNEYRLVEAFMAGWPFSRYAMPVVAFIPEYGVTMWAEKSVFLYKHDARPAGNGKREEPQ